MDTDASTNFQNLVIHNFVMSQEYKRFCDIMAPSLWVNTGFYDVTGHSVGMGRNVEERNVVLI